MKYAMSAEPQRNKLLRYIRDHGSVNTFQDREIGCMSPPPRVGELKALGYNIVANYMTIEDKDGVKHKGVAVYTLDGGKHE
ncbi:MAG: helix-turn-helix domain-containing protein [Ghiorsea sp.]|nr:helix-turn-helix domain-containing protein [Ghiorsea sp.]